MTREEASIILKYYLDCWKRNEEGVPIDNDIEALQMAIEALQQPEIIRCEDCIKCGFCGDNTNLEIMGFNGFCSRAKKKDEEK